MIRILKETLSIEPLKREAYLYVALPRSYDLQPQKRYPVLYAHDGHNLFFPEDSYGGVTWGMQETMGNPTCPECIVVSLSCAMKGHDRIEEYNVFDSTFPSHPLWKAYGRGKDYLDYVFGPLKSMIDQRFRTLVQPEHTYMMGSSMGGVISLEAGFLYPHKVQHIAGLSNAFYVSVEPIITMIKQAKNAPTTLYLDTGDQEEGLEVTSSYLFSNRRIHEVLNTHPYKKRYRYEEIKGGTHHESSWRSRLLDVLKYLFQDSPIK